MKRITIKDLAQHAQVSRGTVDRVLHNRGHVADEVKLKINEAIEELGYKPNIIARTLAQNNVYRIAILIPDPKTDEFWKQPYDGINNVVPEFEDFGVVIEPYYFDNEDPSSLCSMAREMFKVPPDAILMASEFYKESLIVLNEIERLKIPTALIMTYIDSSNQFNYVGQDSFKSGEMAGKLFDMSIRSRTKRILIFNLGATAENTLQIKNKIVGLSSYFNGREDVEMVNVEIQDFKNKNVVRKEINRIKEKYDDISGIFVTNSRTKYIAPVLEELQLVENVCIIGFDLLEGNVHYLKNGTIDFLINQNPEKQAEWAIKKLVDRLVFNKTEITTDYVPLDIVIKENVSCYTSQ